MTAVLQIKDIKRSFTKKSRGKKTLIDVLKGVNLTMTAGEMVALVAPSGSGKSTLLNIVGLLDTPTSGTILFNDKIVSKASEGQGALSGITKYFSNKDASDARKTRIRGENIGFIYQFHHLLPELTVLENVIMPMLARDKNEKEAKKKAKFLLEWVGLWDKRHHFPSQISGGQAQRVAICRALINSPQLLLADEPTGNLDPETAETIFKLFRALVNELKTSALIVTHDFSLARRMDRVLKLQDGVLVEINDLSELHN